MQFIFHFFGFQKPIEKINYFEKILSVEQTSNPNCCIKNFEKGNINGINPDLTLDEQADLLPYDRKFEFPKEKLKLGKQLGTGEFGIVFMAKAKGILSHEVESTVAVKTLKGIAGYEVG